METNLFNKLLLIILIISSGTVSLAQRNYCYSEVGKNIIFPTKRADSLYLDYDKISNAGYIKIVNPTKDTLYLFNSYFTQELQSSKYLHEVDKKNKTYYVSFVPIINYITAKRVDKIILGEESIAHKGQVVYNFIKLTPNTYYVLKINYNDLFKNNKKNRNAVKRYKKQPLNKFNETCFKTITTSKLSGKYNLVFQFGVYTDVRVLCSESDYFLNEFEFNKQAKSFRIINLPVQLNNPDYVLLK